MTPDIEELSRRACSGDKEAQYALEDAAEQLLACGRASEAAAAFKEAATAFRIAAAHNEAHWASSSTAARSLASHLDLLQLWIRNRAKFDPLPRADLPRLSWHEFARALADASDPELGRIAALAYEFLSGRGVEFFSPGGSLQRRLGVLLYSMASGHPPSSETAALLQDPAVRVALDLLADWTARNLSEHDPA